MSELRLTPVSWENVFAHVFRSGGKLGAPYGVRQHTS